MIALPEDQLDRAACRIAYAHHADSLFDINEYSTVERMVYAALLAKLTCFVEDAARCSETPFVLKMDAFGQSAYDLTDLAARYFRRVPDFIKVVGMLSDRYRYGEHLDMFSDACRELGIVGCQYIWEDIWCSPLRMNPCGRTGGELFNALVEIIRRDWVSKGYKERHRRRVREANALSREYQRYADEWFDKQALIVFMRVDLYYKKNIASEISLDDVINDLNHLCANFRCNRIFRGLRGYIAKIEFGLGKSFHIHMIFMFDTASKQARNHVFHAQKIGEYWVKTITKGRGEYWNCNRNLPQFEALGRCGVGPIHVTDMARRSNLSNYVVNYLCKPDQFIRPKMARGVRLMRRGLWPKAAPKKLGAPRRKTYAEIERPAVRVMPPETLLELEVPF